MPYKKQFTLFSTSGPGGLNTFFINDFQKVFYFVTISILYLLMKYSDNIKQEQLHISAQ